MESDKGRERGGESMQFLSGRSAFALGTCCPTVPTFLMSPMDESQSLAVPIVPPKYRKDKIISNEAS